MNAFAIQVLIMQKAFNNVTVCIRNRKGVWASTWKPLYGNGGSLHCFLSILA